MKKIITITDKEKVIYKLVLKEFCEIPQMGLAFETQKRLDSKSKLYQSTAGTVKWHFKKS